MKTKIYPHGTMVEIHYNDEIYYGLLVVDFDRFKTFGNTDIDTELMVFFDEEYNMIPYVNPIYEILQELVKKIVIFEESDDEDDNN